MEIIFIYSAVGTIKLIKWVECSEKWLGNGQHIINTHDYY